jgi:hypothetical protein
MAPSTNVRTALRRLEAALSSIEAASGRLRLASERDDEVAVFAEDRARLAEELDAVNARAQSLDHANRDVARRLEKSMDTIRAILASQGE